MDTWPGGHGRCRWWLVRRHGEEKDHRYYEIVNDNPFTASNFLARKLSFGTLICTGEEATFNDFGEHHRETGEIHAFHIRDRGSLDEDCIGTDAIRLCSACKSFEIALELGE